MLELLESEPKKWQAAIPWIKPFLAWRMAIYMSQQDQVLWIWTRLDHLDRTNQNSPWFTEPAGHRKGSRETRPHRLAATATSTVYNHPLGLRQWLDQLKSFHSSPGSQPASSFPTPRQIWVVTLPFCIDGCLESRPCLVVRRRVGWSTIWSEGCSKGYDIINQPAHYSVILDTIDTYKW